MNIINVIGREIFNSRGVPTIECTLILEDGTSVSASVPSGASRSSFEAVELRDGGLRLMGQGVLKAVQTLEQVIAPILLDREPSLVRSSAEGPGLIRWARAVEKYCTVVHYRDPID